MAPISSPDVHPGQTETQEMRVLAPVGVRIIAHYHLCILLIVPSSQANIRLRLRISFNVAGRAVQDQVDFAGFPPGLTGGS